MADYSDYKECTDCVHYELCLHQEKFLIEHNRKDLIRRYGFGLSEPEICCNFRDRSRFVELTCKVGDTVYAYWDMDNPCSNYLHVIEDFIIDLVILVDRKNSVIGFRAGRTCEQNGRKCDIEFDLKDIGKTVFLTREEAEQALRECGVK